MIEIGDGTTWRDVVAVARGAGPVTLSASARDRIAAAHTVVTEIAARSPVYGRSTGVGANVTGGSAGSPAERDRGLLASHALTAGPALPAVAVRAMLTARLAELAVGRSGASPSAVSAFADLLNAGALPTIGRFHGVGTGDLGALATAVLALPSTELEPGDVLALLSSSALTVGRAALVAADLQAWLIAATAVAAATLTARNGARDAWTRAAAGPTTGATSAAELLRRHLDPPAREPDRLQDPYGLRTAPQMFGVLVDALDRLTSLLDRLLAEGPENPRVYADARAVVHHGAFHSLALTAELDATAVALSRAARGSTQRLALLLEPRSGQAPFLADRPGASGLMAVEFVAASALGEVLAAAGPAGLHSVTLGRGVESDASHAPLAVTQLEAAVGAVRTVVACELVAAVRAIRMGSVRMGADRPGPCLSALLDRCTALPTEIGDRDLTSDVALAEQLLDHLARRDDAGTSSSPTGLPNAGLT